MSNENLYLCKHKPNFPVYLIAKWICHGGSWIKVIVRPKERKKTVFIPNKSILPENCAQCDSNRNSLMKRIESWAFVVGDKMVSGDEFATWIRVHVHFSRSFQIRKFIVVLESSEIYIDMVMLFKYLSTKLHESQIKMTKANI